MRGTSRLLASLAQTSKYLVPDTPTGLTGLSTHPSPRPALLYTYSQTLSRLQSLPQHSVYRQSCEALTKHRMAIIESVKPAGHAEWLSRVTKQIEENPDAYARFKREDGTIMHAELYGTETEIWDGKVGRRDARMEGATESETDAQRRSQMIDQDIERTDREAIEGEKPGVRDLEVEPALTGEQISEIEDKIGAGLIEEVLEVAEGELLLVDEMLQSRAWEDLEEKAPPGQWDYFDRGDRV